MSVTTRHQVGNGDHTPFIFKQFETPPKHPHKQPCEKNIKSTQTQMANVRHNPLYSFENPFGTPSKTPKGENGLVTMVHPDKIKHFLEEQAHENQKNLGIYKCSGERKSMS